MDQLQTIYIKAPKHDPRLPFWQGRMGPWERHVWKENQENSREQPEGAASHDPR